MEKKFEFKEDKTYAICPFCGGRIQALREVKNEEGEIVLEDDPNKRLEVVRKHFEKCEQGNLYKDDPFATYPEE